MKVNICGYEAMEDGLRAGGVGRLICHVTGEPLRNAEKAICEGSFYASRHHKAACVIYEKDIDVLGCLVEKRREQNAGFEIIILGKSLNAGLLKKLSMEGIPLLAAENVNDIRKMTMDGIVYSELRHSPIAVFIPLDRLRSRKAVQSDGKYLCDELWDIPHHERMQRIYAMEDRYNRLYGISHKGTVPKEMECLIIAISGSVGATVGFAGQYRGVCLCKHDLFGTKLQRWQHPEFRRVIIIGSGSTYVREVLTERAIIPYTSTAIELSGDWLHEMQEIPRALKALPLTAEKSGAGMSLVPIYDAPVSIVKSTTVGDGTAQSMRTHNNAVQSTTMRCKAIQSDAVHGKTIRSDRMHIDATQNSTGHSNLRRSMTCGSALRSSTTQTCNHMCSDCPGRAEIKRIMDAHPQTSVYEDIFCEKCGTNVSSGIVCASNAYVSELVITNRREGCYSGIKAEYITIKCKYSK